MPIIHKLTVGQKLFMPRAPHSHMAEKTVTVESVGRKWAILAGNQGRVDITRQKMVLDTYHNTRLYLTKADWERDFSVGKAWNEMAKAIGVTYGRVPDGVTVDSINQARDLLKLPAKA